MRSGKFGFSGESRGFGGNGGFGRRNEATVDEPVVEISETVTEEPTQTVTATYSDEAIAELLFMIEEEKLAGDIYDVFYEMYDLKVFDNIATSEDRHFDALVKQAESLDLDIDEILLQPAGTYVDDELQAMYDTLLAQGSTSVEDALEVGVLIETKDMEDIADAAAAVEGTTLAGVYQNLLTGSGYHLDAFEALL